MPAESTPDGADAEGTALVHFDEYSFGVYPFPLKATPVDALPPDSKLVDPPRGTYAFGKLKGSLLSDLETADLPRAQRSNPVLDQQVRSLLRLPPSAAPVVFAQAIAGFWLNRYRLSRARKELFDRGAAATMDLQPILEERRSDRLKFVQHSHSIWTKLLGLQYLAGEIRRLVAAVKASSASPFFELVAASATLRAYDEALYSLLEETAVVLALFHAVTGRTNLPTSFHKLHKDQKSKAPEPLRAILDKATWYEPFRLRRANSAHTFAAQLTRQGDDLYLFQHPDARNYVDTALPETVQRAQEALEPVLSNFPPFYARLSAYALTYFHPWDVVQVPTALALGEEVDVTPVWVRRVEFMPEYERAGNGWAIMDEGRVVLRTKEGGGIARVEA